MIKKEVIDIISTVTRIDKEKIKDNSSLRDDLFVDSLQAVQIVNLIQDKYNIKIDEIEIFNVDNLTDIVAIVNEYLEK
ncbi:MAG: acyl carrier protein [Spirochaetes bacterium]|nr:acyl carrier protein [Spirochaetota bacterium]